MSRLTLVVVIAALLVPASAQARVVGDPQPPAPTPYAGTHYPVASTDSRTPDAQDFAAGRTPVVVQDLRSPDARPDSRPLQAPEAPSAGPRSVDWPSVGIGAALFAVLTLGAASIAIVVRRTRTRAI
jgi:hypothetical protein